MIGIHFLFESHTRLSSRSFLYTQLPVVSWWLDTHPSEYMMPSPAFVRGLLVDVSF